MQKTVKVMAAFRGFADQQGKRRPGGVAPAMYEAAAVTGATLLSFAGSSPNTFDRIIRQTMFETETVTELDPALVAGGYYAANTTFWPEAHGQGSYLRDVLGIEPEGTSNSWPRHFELYLDMNRAMTEQVLAAAKDATELELVTHDYQLARVPRQVRKRRPGTKICHFVHTPWAIDLDSPVIKFLDEYAVGLVAADKVGFHTPLWREDYIRHLEVRFGDRYWIDRSGDDPIVRRFNNNRTTVLFVQSISIDGERWKRLARGRMSFGLPSGVFVWLGVERCDHTKGILERFQMIRRFFEMFPELKRRVTWVQIAEPSRENIPAFQRYKEELEKVVRGKDGERCLTEPDETGWQMLIWHQKGVKPEDLGPVYCAANGITCTPHIDGYGMVYAEAQISGGESNPRASVLGKRAGCSYDLGKGACALVENPMDIDALAVAHRNAMMVSEQERREKQFWTQQQITSQPLSVWARRPFAELETVTPQFVPVGQWN
jgi:trehalose-6-phosphate synthase